MFKTNFSERNKIWGTQKRYGVTAPEYPPASAGLGRTVARKSSIGSLSPTTTKYGRLAVN